MKWEIKEIEDGKWGIFLCKKYWKFKDRPVMYASSVSKESAQKRVDRMNNPIYDFGVNYVTVKQAREAERKKKREAKLAAAEEKKKK